MAFSTKSESVTHIPAHEKVNKAIRQMFFRAPFYGALMSKFRIEKASSSQITTFATDGKTIWYCEEFVDGLTWQEVAFILCHEVDHKCLLHLSRRGARLPEPWNMAGDAVINRRLISYFDSDGINFKMPHYADGSPMGILYDWVGDDHTTEYVYDKLMQDAKAIELGRPGLGFGGGQDIKDPPPGNAGDNDGLSEAEVLQDIIEAASTAKMMGKMPNHIQRLIDSIPERLVNWRDVISNEIRTLLGADDWSYMRPRRSGMAQGLILPALVGNVCPPLTVAIDVSGSFTDEVAQCYAEVKAILEDCRPEKVLVIQADAAVQSTEWYENASELPSSPEWRGGGGTDFRPAFEKSKELNPGAPIIYITDAYGTFPEEEVNDTIWCIINGTEDVPWGKLVKVK